MMNFPPSSPLLGEDKPKDRVNRFTYPTPNPSSTLGRDSSPDYKKGTLGSPRSSTPANEPENVQNKDFHIMIPAKDYLSIPLYSQSKSSILIGRSTSSDYVLNAKDRMISRAHLSIVYSSEQIILDCMGLNGFAIRIPKTCSIYSTSVKNNYIIYETEAPMEGLETLKSKTIHLMPGLTEFTVAQGECITMPRIHNIVIEVRGQVILLNPENDEPEPVNNKPIHIEPSETPLTQKKKEVPEPPAKTKIGYPDLSTPSKPPKIPIFQDKATPARTALPAVSVKKERSKTPLADKTNTKRKRKSTEKPNKAVKKEANEANEVTETKEVNLDSIENVAEVSNILINHLAFSRLSSTPASFLKTISVITSKLSLEQIRKILDYTKSIGVIYREGKDAAGKPLDEEYYYMPENDDDTARVELVKSIKGHGGLRSCRKTHKQYYWKKPK